MGKSRKSDSSTELKLVPFNNDEVDEVERCRRVRREIDARFKTLDEMFDFFSKLESDRARKGIATRSAKTRAVKHRAAENQQRKATKG